MTGERLGGDNKRPDTTVCKPGGLLTKHSGKNVSGCLSGNKPGQRPQLPQSTASCCPRSDATTGESGPAECESAESEMIFNPLHLYFVQENTWFEMEMLTVSRAGRCQLSHLSLQYINNVLHQTLMTRGVANSGQLVQISPPFQKMQDFLAAINLSHNTAVAYNKNN